MSSVFTIYEASAALYAEGADGEATGDPIYVGECMENVEVSADYELTRLEQHGRPAARKHPGDATLKVSWERWFTVKEEEGELITPFLDRFGRYVLVLVWFEEQASRWVKMILKGVVPEKDPVAVSEGVMTNNKVLDAESREVVTGFASRPDLTAVLIGTLLWISGGASTIAYTYDFDTEEWASTGDVSPSLVEVDDVGDFTLSMHGSPVLWVDSGYTRLGELHAVGSFDSVDPDADRLEFRRGSQVYFSIEDGAPAIVRVRNLIERDTRPGGGNDVALLDASGEWAASLLPGGLRAIEVIED